MFDYTQAAAKQIAADFQKVLYIISVCSQAVYIGYLLYALFAGAGVLWVNIVLLAISSAYFAFFFNYHEMRQASGRRQSENHTKNGQARI